MQTHHEAHADLLGQANVVQHTCTVCGALFESRTKLAKYCSKPCKWKAENAARIADGRLAEYRAKNREHRNAQAKIYKLEITPCSVCGVLVQRKTAHKRQFICSYDCRSYLRFGKWPSSEIPWQHPIRSTPVPLDHPTRASVIVARVRFSVGVCVWCGDWFIADRLAYSNLTDRACSVRCIRRYRSHVRRAIESSAQAVGRGAVFIRDEWICQLCHEPVDRSVVVPHPLSPTVDHIVPIVAGGQHTLENLQTAHFTCNCQKHTQSMAEYLS